jgi:agmatinase
MYNPNTNCLDNGNFAALDSCYEKSDIILFPTPWEATVSYREGTINAPDLIRLASLQLDLFDKRYESIDVSGRIYWDHSLYDYIYDLALITRQLVRSKIQSECNLDFDLADVVRDQILVNCSKFNDMVYNHSLSALGAGKIVGLVGGDHSIPFGQIKAVGEYYSSFGIVHIDAHHDLRPYFQGFKFSHGSIFHNVLSTVKSVDKLVQVGIRDYCKKEFILAKNHPKVTTYYDADISEQVFSGSASWGQVVSGIIESLPQHVYISLDMDGLTIENTLSTGTPVPGGISYAQIRYLINELAKSRTIIGFDVVECGPSEIDSLVAMRLIFQLCNAALHTISKI